MPYVVENALENIQYLSAPSLETLEESDKEARVMTQSFIKRIQL
jgi:hypothetical protein